MITVSDFIDDLAAPRRRTLSIGRVKLPWPFPIAYGLHSSCAMVFGVPAFGTDSTIIRLLHRTFRTLGNAKYWLYYRVHPSHRYHMIDTKLGYGYHERDAQLLYGAMACFIGYVEDCENSGVHDPGDEARAILHWWRVTRQADQAQYEQWIDDLYGQGKSRINFVPVEGQPKLMELQFDSLSSEDDAKRQAMRALDEKIHKDEQDFLHRLINIRQSMWT